MSTVEQVVVLVDGSSWVNKVIYEPDTGRQEIITIGGASANILHQIPLTMFIAFVLSMLDFKDKDGNDSAGAAVSHFIKTHSDYNIKTLDTWADALVDDLNDAQKDALMASLSFGGCL